MNYRGNIMKKRIGAFLCAASLVLSLFAGCASSSTAAQTSSMSTTAVVSSQTVISSTPSETESSEESISSASSVLSSAKPVVSSTKPVASSKATTPSSKPKSIQQQPKAETPKSITVYITKTEKKYHRDGCRYLSRSKISISLSDAKAEGYTPCSVCNPPD